MIGWCSMPTLAVFELYPGMNKCYINLRHIQDPYIFIDWLIDWCLMPTLAKLIEKNTRQKKI